MKIEIDAKTEVRCYVHPEVKLEAAIDIMANRIMVKPCHQCSTAMVRATMEAAKEREESKK